jgi:hypothetical protein
LTGRHAASILIFALAACCAPSAGAQPAISITDFSAEPSHLELDTNGPPAEIVLILTLSNAGDSAGTVNVNISEEDNILFSENATVVSRSTLTRNFTWVARLGAHSFSVTITGDAAGHNTTMATEFSGSYVPVKNPSPWYTIPCAFLVIIIPVVAIYLGIRWLDSGGRTERDKDG